jgi:ABC-type nitrate/sulfonate/bicarbonate transport system ATPase subunit
MMRPTEDRRLQQGMRQRVKMAQALALLILDEPLSAWIG